LLCLRNARAFPLLPAALASVPFGFVLVRVRVHFPSDEVQNEAVVRGSTPVSANNWGKNTAAMAILIQFAFNWASLIFLRAMQFEVGLLSAIVVPFLPFLQSSPGNSRGVVVL